MSKCAIDNVVVQVGVLNKGSKSEHLSCYIEQDGRKYKLSRVGQNPFTDNYFDQFVGKKVNIKGSIVGQSLFVDELNEK